MNKIAIAFSGPIRGNYLFNIKYLLKQFKGYTYDTYFITWNNNKGLDIIINNNIIDNILIYNEPGFNFIKNIFKGNVKYSDRTYKMFWQRKTVIDIIKGTNIKYNYLVLVRPDTIINLNNISSVIFSNNYVFQYEENYIKGTYPGNDLFAMGPIDILDKVYNYKTIKNFNTIVKNLPNNEQILSYMIKISKVKFIFGDIDVSLDENRHLYDSSILFRIKSITINTFNFLYNNFIKGKK